MSKLMVSMVRIRKRLLRRLVMAFLALIWKLVAYGIATRRKNILKSMKNTLTVGLIAWTIWPRIS